MPIIRIDYNPRLINKATIRSFSEYMLEESVRIFGMKKELYSMFVSEYGEMDFSTAQIEVEIYCGAHEFEGFEESAKDRSDRISTEHAKSIKLWKKDKDAMGIICTITASNWKVNWVD